MINHGRTLLLNIDGSTRPDGTYIGEEYIDPLYLNIKLPISLSRIRGALLGFNSDRATLNYKLNQLLKMVHSTSLAHYVTDLDHRITYLDNTDTRLFDPTTYSGIVKLLEGSNTWAINLIGNPSTVRSNGLMFDSWDIELQTVTSVAVSHRVKDLSTAVTSITYTSGLSSIVPLTGTGFTFTINQGVLSELPKWSLDIITRPESTITDIFDLVKKQLDTDESLFLNEQPYVELFNTWRASILPVPIRLSAVVIALMYRIEKLRVQGV